jgi:hypothetical protein
VMTLIDTSFGRARKVKPERGVEVGSVVPRELADQLRMMATEIAYSQRNDRVAAV